MHDDNMEHLPGECQVFIPLHVLIDSMHGQKNKFEPKFYNLRLNIKILYTKWSDGTVWITLPIRRWPKVRNKDFAGGTANNTGHNWLILTPFCGSLAP